MFRQGCAGLHSYEQAVGVGILQAFAFWAIANQQETCFGNVLLNRAKGFKRQIEVFFLRHARDQRDQQLVWLDAELFAQGKAAALWVEQFHINATIQNAQFGVAVGA